MNGHLLIDVNIDMRLRTYLRFTRSSIWQSFEQPTNHHDRDGNDTSCSTSRALLSTEGTQLIHFICMSRLLPAYPPNAVPRKVPHNSSKFYRGTLTLRSICVLRHNITNLNGRSWSLCAPAPWKPTTALLRNMWSLLRHVFINTFKVCFTATFTKAAHRTCWPR